MGEDEDDDDDRDRRVGVWILDRVPGEWHDPVNRMSKRGQKSRHRG